MRRSYPHPHVHLDGAELRSPNGTCRVFAPPWWRLDRWLGWLWVTRVRKLDHGTVTCHVVGGAPREVRAILESP